MTTPTLAFWHRIEPRPRATSISRSLAAQVRDPLWYLTRQWQLGEFRGEDAGAPAYLELAIKHTTIRAQRLSTTWEPIAAGDAPEVRANREGMPESDLTVATELGLEFEQFLQSQGVPAQDVTTIRAALPPLAIIDSVSDGASAAWLNVCDRRVSNGTYIAREEPSAFQSLIQSLNLGAPTEQFALDAAAHVRVHASLLYGSISDEDPSAWQADRLRYQFDSGGEAPDASPVAFAGRPGLSGEMDWYSFDQHATAAQVPGTPSTPVARTLRRLPTHVQFRGMPNARFWDFEPHSTDFGDLRPDKRDLARLVVLDFMLVQGNDWFVIPVDLPVGSLATVDYLVVRDVFGGLTAIPNANSPTWSLFATSVQGATTPAPYLMLPATLGSARMSGATLEDVRFQRDEMANLTWGIEHSISNAVGDPSFGHERAHAGLPPSPAPPAMPPQGAAPLKYVIQTDVPPHWVPFMPVAIGGNQVALERTVMGMVGTTYGNSGPEGRILNPSNVTGAYRVREEEVPRSGARIVRVVCRARWSDGSTHVWVERRRTSAEGEANSGLRFDVAAPNDGT